MRKIQKDYDIIHLHLPNPFAAVLFQLTRYKGKLVLHWHSDIVRQKVLRKLYYPFQYRLLKKADRVIVTSQNYLDGSADLKPFKSKCVVIPIGIDKHEIKVNQPFRNELEEKYDGKMVIFSLGRLIYYKGFDYLIAAATKLPDNYTVLIGGVGELEQQLRQQIENSRLEGKVQLVGKIPLEELGAYYDRADIFCLPSHERSEAFGVVLIEALSFSKPLISSSIPGSGVNWVNEHKVTGLVVEPKNAAAIADAVIEIGSNKSVMNDLAVNAGVRFARLFDKDKMILSITELYKEILAE